MNQRGFALISLLISLVILSALMLIVYNTLLRQSIIFQSAGSAGASPASYLDKAREAQQQVIEKHQEQLKSLESAQ